MLRLYRSDRRKRWQGIGTGFQVLGRRCNPGLLYARNEWARGCHRNEAAQAASADHLAHRSSGCPQASLEVGGRLHNEGSLVQPVVAHDRTVVRMRISISAFV